MLRKQKTAINKFDDQELVQEELDLTKQVKAGLKTQGSLDSFFNGMLEFNLTM